MRPCARDTTGRGMLKRWVTTLGREVPLLPFVPSMLLGQLLAWWCRDAHWSLATLALLLVVPLAFLKFPRLGLGVLAGALSVACYPLPSAPTLSGLTPPLLALVDQKPRYPRPGGVEVSLKVLRWYSNGGSPSVVPFRTRCRAVLLPWRNSRSLQTGDLVIARIEYAPRAEESSPFSYEGWLRRYGYSGECRVALISQPLSRDPPLAHKLSERIQRAIEAHLGNGERSGLLLAMAFGLQDQISKETEAAFRATNLAHLLVVSGYQVSLVFFSSVAMLRVAVRFLSSVCRSGFAELLVRGGAFLLACVYALIVDGDHSVTRAIVALALFSLGGATERLGGVLRSTLGAFLLMAVVWPGSYFEPGTQLTFAALTGFAIASAERPARAGWLGYLLGTVAAGLCTSIVGIWWFGNFSLCGVIYNLLFVPFLSFVSCQMGVGATILNVVGLDPFGWGLRGVGAILSGSRDLILLLARSTPVIDLPTWQERLIASSMLGIGVLYLGARRMRSWGDARGL